MKAGLSEICHLAAPGGIKATRTVNDATKGSSFMRPGEGGNNNTWKASSIDVPNNSDFSHLRITEVPEPESHRRRAAAWISGKLSMGSSS